MKQFIFDHWLLLSPILYEIIARVWPTRWNISLLDNIWKLIDFFIPNKRIPDGREKMVHIDETENIIFVPTKKHILKIILILCLFSFGVKAQIWQNFKGVRLVNNSDTTKQFPVQGSIFFDDVDNVFYGHNSIGWKSLISAGGGGLSGLTSPRIPFALSPSTLGDDVALSWDNANKILLLGNGTNGQLRFNVLTEFDVKANTLDGFDNKVLSLSGGGDDNITRGAVIKVAGNENTTQGNGVLELFAGNAIGADIKLKTGSAASTRFRISDSGVSRFSNDNLVTGIDINPTSRIIENNITGSFGINNGVGDLNLSGTNNLTLNTAASTRFRINSVGEARFSNDNLVTGIDISPGTKTITNIGIGLFKITNNNGALEFGPGTSTTTITASSNILLSPNTGNVIINRNVELNPINASSHLFGGIYTPTFTAIANVSAIVDSSNGRTKFIRIMNTVTVTGSVNVTPTAANTLTEFRISLPIASNFSTSSFLLIGNGTTVSTTENFNSVATAETTNNQALYQNTPPTTGLRTIKYNFTYEILP